MYSRFAFDCQVKSFVLIIEVLEPSLTKHFVICRNFENFILGSKERLVFDVKIVNNGEDAFEAVFFMIFPEGWNYQRIDSSRNTPITCTFMTAAGATLKCDIGNPFPAGKTVSNNGIG